MFSCGSSNMQCVVSQRIFNKPIRGVSVAAGVSLRTCCAKKTAPKCFIRLMLVFAPTLYCWNIVGKLRVPVCCRNVFYSGYHPSIGVSWRACWICVDQKLLTKWIARRSIAARRMTLMLAATSGATI